MRLTILAVTLDRIRELNALQLIVVAFPLAPYLCVAYAAVYPDKVERLVVMDAPIPGIEPWSEILQSPGVWHFNFHGPDAERLVAGRERIYFDGIWNDFTVIQASQMRQRETFSPRPMRNREACVRALRSSPHSLKTQRTTKSSSRRS